MTAWNNPMNRLFRTFIGLALLPSISGICSAENREPLVVGHRGLLLDAPENTLANFAACLHLRLGFEFDVQRSRDVVGLAVRHGVLDRLLFIGRTIDNAGVRRRLRTADARSHAAVLATTRDELKQAIDDTDSDWVYLRFIPEASDVAAIHAAGKRAFLSG